MKKYFTVTIVTIALLFVPLFNVTNASAAIGTPGYGFMVHLDVDSDAMTAEMYEDTLADFRRDIDTMVEYEQTWARFAIPSWAVSYFSDGNVVVKPTDDAAQVPAITYFEEAIDYMNSKGLNVYLILVGTTSQGPELTQAEYTQNISRYWEFIAERVADDVELIQIYNEAQSYHYRFYSSVADADLPAYWAEMSTMFGIASDIFKAENPNVQMTTNSYGWPIGPDVEAAWLAFFDAVHENLDVITLDMYPDTQEEIPLLIEYIANAKNRYNKPVVVGETGRQGFVDAGNDYSRSIPGQEENVVLYMDAFRQSEASAILMYQLRDGGPDQTQGEQNFGILEYDGTRKASFDGIMYSMRPVIVPDPVNPDGAGSADGAGGTTGGTADGSAPGAPNTGLAMLQPAVLSATAGIGLLVIMAGGLVLKLRRHITN